MNKNDMVKALIVALAVSGWGGSMQYLSAEQATGGSSPSGATGTMGTDSNATGTGVGSNSNQSAPSGAASEGAVAPKSNATNASISAPVTGTVQSVNASQKQLQLRDSLGNTLNLDVPASASIMNGANKGRLSDIKTGDSVVITYGKNGKVKKVERQADASNQGASTNPGGSNNKTY